jgi:putative ATP-dependent endonuclease of OLD family
VGDNSYRPRYKGNKDIGVRVRITRVQIRNFRAHELTDLPLSQFGCLIGENNAGKSSVLHALQFALEGGKLNRDDFHSLEDAVSVTVTIEEISSDDLARITDASHNARIESILRHQQLTLVRSQVADNRSELKYLALEPLETRWTETALEEATKGRRAKELRPAAVELLPELDDILTASPTASAVKAARQSLVSDLPADQLHLSPRDLPTGIAAGIKPLLPEIIYIEAVKDATTETRTAETATFGKLLKLLFTAVEDQFADLKAQFAEVHKKLSRVTAPDGEESDGRLEQVQLIESTIQKYVQSSFPGVSLKMEVPSPTLSTLLGSAELRVDDGHEGPLSTKGDGLKRTVLFAILRAYTNLRTSGLTAKENERIPKPAYLLLFEEPELYLHPRAQRQLMATLATFAVDHPVLVTTHSAGFFGPSTKGFAKLQKTDGKVTPYPVELDMKARDAYQLVQYDNNEAAFFAKTVVLVEGDSDTFTFPHIAKVLNPKWDHNEHNVMFVKTGGKTSFNRYRQFFSQFDVQVHIITDLDALAEGFAQLAPSDEAKEQHSKLGTLLAAHLPQTAETKSDKVRKITGRVSARETWVAAQEQLQAWQSQPSANTADSITSLLTTLFDQGHTASKTSLLKTPPTPDIESARDDLVDALISEHVYVLRRGDLEDYCATAAADDKVETAIQFCADVTTRDAFIARHSVNSDKFVNDLEKIFESIFSISSTGDVH